MEKELRIGNWINDHEGIPRQVAYSGQTIGLDIGDGATQKYQHDPIISGDINTLAYIPLDEDWLLSFGFKKRKKLWHFHIHFRIGIDDNMNLYLDGTHWIKLEYVHRLQNLYFSLCEKELEMLK